jgi:hypothetical protein
MEKTIPPFPFTIAREEEKEEIKLQYQEFWHGETLGLITRSTRENLLKPIDPHSLQPPARCRSGRRGTSGGGWLGGCARAGVAQDGRTFPSFLDINVICTFIM